MSLRTSSGDRSTFMSNKASRVFRLTMIDRRLTPKYKQPLFWTIIFMMVLALVYMLDEMDRYGLSGPWLTVLIFLSLFIFAVPKHYDKHTRIRVILDGDNLSIVSGHSDTLLWTANVADITGIRITGTRVGRVYRGSRIMDVGLEIMAHSGSWSGWIRDTKKAVRVVNELAGLNCSIREAVDRQITNVVDEDKLLEQTAFGGEAAQVFTYDYSQAAVARKHWWRAGPRSLAAFMVVIIAALYLIPAIVVFVGIIYSVLVVDFGGGGYTELANSRLFNDLMGWSWLMYGAVPAVLILVLAYLYGTNNQHKALSGLKIIMADDKLLATFTPADEMWNYVHDDISYIAGEDAASLVRMHVWVNLIGAEWQYDADAGCVVICGNIKYSIYDDIRVVKRLKQPSAMHDLKYLRFYPCFNPDIISALRSSAAREVAGGKPLADRLSWRDNLIL